MKISWNKVTWYSQIIAIILYILTLGFGFYIGTEYQKAISETAIQNTKSLK